MGKIDINSIITLENEFDKFLNNYNKDIPIILYGFGGGITNMPQTFRNYGINPVAICDKDENKQGKIFEGIPVISFGEALKRYDYFNVYISVSNYYKEIEDFLLQYIEPGRIFSYGHFKDMSTGEYRNFLVENITNFENMMNMFDDDISRQTLTNVLKGRLSNDLSYFKEVYFPEQYFSKHIMNLGDNETFIDGGAFTGDTILDFLRETNGRYNKIYAFEPDINCFNCISNLPYDNLITFNKGLYKYNTVLGFNNDVSKGAHILDYSSNENGMIEVVSIDEKISDTVTFIKMDIEGCELAALKGAEKTIKKYKPKLAICVYHKNKDIIDIPNYIMSLGLNYKYYLRHHSHSLDETVFYAV